MHAQVLPRDAELHLMVAWATGALMSYVADFYRRCARLLRMHAARMRRSALRHYALACCLPAPLKLRRLGYARIPALVLSWPLRR
jgi:hypothetical protein